MFDKILTAIVVFGFSFLAFAVAIFIQDQRDNGIISLDRIIGSVQAVPDFADIHLSIDVETNESKEETAKKFSDTNAKLNAIFTQNGIDSKHIYFENIAINDWETSKFREDGTEYMEKNYSMNQYLRVSFEGENFKKVSNFVNAIALVENISLGSVHVDIKNKEELYAKARENALQKAKSQAQVMANNLWVKLWKVVSVSVQNPYDDYNTVDFKLANTVSEASADPISGIESEQEYSVEVSVSYEIK